MLADGRPWLLGEAASWADAACYAPVWMCRGNIQGAQDLLQNLPHVQAWEERVAALSHGQRIEMDAAEALAISRAAMPEAVAELAMDRWPQLQLGDAVNVTPEDYGAVPVPGELVRLTQHDIAIRRIDEQAGDVVVHFPRVGYRVSPQ